MKNLNILHQFNASDLRKCLYTFIVEGDLSGVCYVLTEQNLKNRIDIHHDAEHALYLGLCSGNVEITRYLLTSSDLNEHSDITYVKGKHGVIHACCHGHLPLVQYLIEETTLNMRLNTDELEYLFKIIMMNKHTEMLNYLLFSEEKPDVWNLDNLLQEFEHYYLTAGCLDRYLLLLQKYTMGAKDTHEEVNLVM